MENEKHRKPCLIPAEREGSVHECEGDTDAGIYIAQLANAWAAVRKKSFEQQ